jgi:Protein of unknown function (DUF1638)
MSSSLTVRTSTTGSSNSSPSPPAADERFASAVAPTTQDANPASATTIIACGALAQPIAAIVARRGWVADVHPLPPLLHNHPERIAAEVESLVADVSSDGPVVVAYADCGTYGALDELCTRRGWARLPGLHCYDVYGGADRLRAMMEQQPGTYILTDFLVRGFDRLVVAELGLDRHPELRDDYFGHYTRVVWLAQRPDAELRRLATRAADTLGLPLTELDVGEHRLEHALDTALSTVSRRDCTNAPPALTASANPTGSGGAFVQSRR